jgi:hypothetical protein
VERSAKKSPADTAISVIPRDVARHLGYYVYLWVDPRSGRPFYVGKGQQQRALSHLQASGENRKAKVFAELRAASLDPRLEILAHALPDEEAALRIEAAVIDLFGLDGLTNAVRGWRSIQLGRMPLSELIAYYAARPVHILDPMLLIRINRLYRHNMTPQELYEATRGVWKLSERRKHARFAAAVFESVVREVYEIDSWHPAGTTPYETRPKEQVSPPGRVEFLGRVAESEVRTRYVGGSVAAYFVKGLQSPVVYVSC